MRELILVLSGVFGFIAALGLASKECNEDFSMDNWMFYVAAPSTVSFLFLITSVFTY